MCKNTCCFFGHRKMNITDELKMILYSSIETLITKENVTTFLFGSNSVFDDLCHQTVSAIKSYYPFIRRIYVRAQFPNITDDYTAYLLQNFENTYFPCSVLNSKKGSYIRRNQEMIDNSKFCIIYFDRDYIPIGSTDSPHKSKSGTAIAYEYALLKNRTVINLYEALHA